MTEDKIREAWDIYHSEFESDHDDFCSFRAGYLAMLNSLVPRYHIAANEMMYQLPEGVSRNE